MIPVITQPSDRTFQTVPKLHNKHITMHHESYGNLSVLHKTFNTRTINSDEFMHDLEYFTT